MAEDNRNFTLKIITPDRVFYEEEVSMVEFNTVEGEVGYKSDSSLKVSERKSYFLRIVFIGHYLIIES